MFRSSVIFLALLATLVAAQAAETEDQNNSVGDEIVKIDKPDKANEIAEAKLEKSDGKNLKQKKLSEAFEKFIPSEKISADNAVPFPVDI